MFLQKESPSMGIERIKKEMAAEIESGEACKKSPQAWGLKALTAFLVTGFHESLAKRVPKHGD